MWIEPGRILLLAILLLLACLPGNQLTSIVNSLSKQPDYRETATVVLIGTHTVHTEQVATMLDLHFNRNFFKFNVDINV